MEFELKPVRFSGRRLAALLVALCMVIALWPAALAADEAVTGATGDAPYAEDTGATGDAPEAPTDATGDAPGGFTDVPPSAYYVQSVIWAVDAGITKGVSATSFAPDEKCTRGEVVTFLWRLAGKPQVSGVDVAFEDVAPGRFYSEAVKWAVANGITKGVSATSFAPDDSCNRAEIVTFLWRYAGARKMDAENPFEDVGQSWYTDAVLWAVDQGITRGNTLTTFDPMGDCTRCQTVTFLYRLANTLG